MALDLVTLKACAACSCSCWLVSKDCLVALSELTGDITVRSSDINNANSDVGDLLGEVCFDQLCIALSAAGAEANAYNEDPQNEDKKTILDFLHTKWAAVIANRHFKTWYSNRVAWYWLEGSSITQLKAVGLITAGNDDDEFKNNFKHAQEKQRKRLAEVSERIASNAEFKFKRFFWDLPGTAKNYSCNVDFCCEVKADSPGESIGMFTLD